MSLARWYEENGRHDLAWHATRDPWLVLVSEVMLQQTQVARIAVAWPEFIPRFPTPQAMADAGPGAVIEAWGRLGYPRRARRLWETAVHLATAGWPDDLTELPGIGRYTAAALRCLVDDADVPAVEVNVRRVVERVTGKRLTEHDAEAAMVVVGKPLRGRDRLLALMDIGATTCRHYDPQCRVCPLKRRCRDTAGPLPEATRSRQPGFEGSFRQRRGIVLSRLRTGPTPVALLDAPTLRSLVADGLAALDGDGELARLP